jgi:hypothetical protein
MIRCSGVCYVVLCTGSYNNSCSSLRLHISSSEENLNFIENRQKYILTCFDQAISLIKPGQVLN